ncbi:hypothetical protein D9M70_588530 [compost metagenome]
MPTDVAVEAAAFPVAVSFGFDRDTGIDQVGRQQLVGIQGQNVLPVCVLGIFENPFAQPYLFEGKGFLLRQGGCAENKGP